MGGKTPPRSRLPLQFRTPASASGSKKGAPPPSASTTPTSTSTQAQANVTKWCFKKEAELAEVRRQLEVAVDEGRRLREQLNVSLQRDVQLQSTNQNLQVPSFNPFIRRLFILTVEICWILICLGILQTIEQTKDADGSSFFIIIFFFVLPAGRRARSIDSRSGWPAWRRKPRARSVRTPTPSRICATPRPPAPKWKPSSTSSKYGVLLRSQRNGSIQRTKQDWIHRRFYDYIRRRRNTWTEFLRLCLVRYTHT